MFDRLKGKGRGGPSDAPPGYEQAVGNPRFEKGDLVLVSSDRIKFNVPSEKCKWGQLSNTDTASVRCKVRTPRYAHSRQLKLPRACKLG